jgi:hypothetical protein
VAVVFCGLLAGFWTVYRLWIHYERRAAKHLPESAVAAARLDLEQVVLFEPFRQHVLGTMKRLVTEAEWSELSEQLGVNFGMDLREVMVALGERGNWVLVIAGLFPDHVLVGRLDAWFHAHAPDVCHAVGERLECPGLGIVAQQAADGSMIGAADVATLEQALVASERFVDLGLDLQSTAIQFGWRVAAPSSGVPSLAAAGLALVPGSNVLGQTRAVGGRVLLEEDDAKVEVRFTPNDGIDVQGYSASLESARQTLQTLATLGRPEAAGEATLLAKARISVARGAGASGVLVESSWPRRDIDRAAQLLGEALARWVDSVRR